MRLQAVRKWERARPAFGSADIIDAPGGEPRSPAPENADDPLSAVQVKIVVLKPDIPVLADQLDLPRVGVRRDDQGMILEANRQMRIGKTEMLRRAEERRTLGQRAVPVKQFIGDIVPVQIRMGECPLSRTVSGGLMVLPDGQAAMLESKVPRVSVLRSSCTGV